MVRNVAVEVENRIRTIKVSVLTASGIRNSRKFMGIIGGNPSIKMTVLGSRF